MTTTVVVKANHGWDVKVTATDPTNNKLVYERVVKANTEETLCVHSNADLLIHEIQPNELKSD
jgi:hypothetical protein